MGIKSLELAAGQQDPGPGSGAQRGRRERTSASRGFECPSQAPCSMVNGAGGQGGLEAWVGLGATPALSPCPALDPWAALEPQVLSETQFCSVFFQSVTPQVLFCVLQTYFGNCGILIEV